MKKNNEDGAIFYAPDSFDRSVLAYCTSNPVISNTVAMNTGSTMDCYTLTCDSAKSIGISGTVDTVKDRVSELADRICALEAAMAKPVRHKPPVSAQRWRYDRRDYKTLK